MAMDLRKFRVDDELWQAASERAAAEGTTLSAMLRLWMEDYVSDAPAHRAKIRLSAVEREAVALALCELNVADVVVDAINKGR